MCWIASILGNASLKFLPEFCHLGSRYYITLIVQGAINQTLIYSLFSMSYGPNTGVSIENAN